MMLQPLPRAGIADGGPVVAEFEHHDESSLHAYPLNTQGRLQWQLILRGALNAVIRHQAPQPIGLVRIVGHKITWTQSVSSGRKMRRRSLVDLGRATTVCASTVGAEPDKHGSLASAVLLVERRPDLRRRSLGPDENAERLAVLRGEGETEVVSGNILQLIEHPGNGRCSILRVYANEHDEPALFLDGLFEHQSPHGCLTAAMVTAGLLGVQPAAQPRIHGEA